MVGSYSAKTGVMVWRKNGRSIRVEVSKFVSETLPHKHPHERSNGKAIIHHDL